MTCILVALQHDLIVNMGTEPMREWVIQKCSLRSLLFGVKLADVVQGQCKLFLGWHAHAMSARGGPW